MPTPKSVQWRHEKPLPPECIRRPHDVEWETEVIRRSLTAKILELGVKDGAIPMGEMSEPPLEHFAFAARIRIGIEPDWMRAGPMDHRPQKLVGDLCFIPMPEGLEPIMQRLRKAEAENEVLRKRIEEMDRELGEAWANALQQGDEAF